MTVEPSWGGVPPGYHVVETPDRVPTDPVAVSRFRWLAARRRRQYEARRAQTAAEYGINPLPSYRLELVHEDGRWVVAAFQNVLEPDEQPGAELPWLGPRGQLPWLGPGPAGDRDHG